MLKAMMKRKEEHQEQSSDQEDKSTRLTGDSSNSKWQLVTFCDKSERPRSPSHRIRQSERRDCGAFEPLREFIIDRWSQSKEAVGARSQTKCWPAKGRLLWNLIEFFHRTKFMTTGLTNFLSTKNWTVSVWVIFQSKTIIAHWQHLIMKRASKLLGTIIPSVVRREDIRLIMQPTRFTMHKTADSMSSTLPYSAEYQGIMS